jgi:hypothetical protein
MIKGKLELINSLRINKLGGGPLKGQTLFRLSSFMYRTFAFCDAVISQQVRLVSCSQNISEVCACRTDIAGGWLRAAGAAVEASHVLSNWLTPEESAWHHPELKR